MSLDVMLVPDILALAHGLVRDAVPTGGIAIDATTGNGRDTLHLCECVGQEGRVFGFDIQDQALRATAYRLRQAGCRERCSLIKAGHEHMIRQIPGEAVGRVNAVMFNLGYLPRGDKEIVTHPETTMAALDQSLEALAPGGVITVVCYRGHPGGVEEYEAVLGWLETVSGTYRVARYEEPSETETNKVLFALTSAHA